MERSSARVMLIVVISKVFGLDLAAGLAFRGDSMRSQGEPAVRLRSSQFVPSVGIQDSKELNKTCCLNGGTCMLGSFCACPPSFYGRNCEHDIHKENCGPVAHGAWLPRRCSMCKCWHGQLHCFSQAFLPGCDGPVMDEHLAASRTPGLAWSAHTTLMLAGLCLAVQSYCRSAFTCDIYRANVMAS